MANGYGIPILSGLLKGLGGITTGMDQADRVTAEQARLAEQQREFDEGRFTDLSSLAPVLGPLGVNLGTQPGQKVPTALVPTVLGAHTAQAEKARKAAERAQLAAAAKGTPLEPYAALLGIEGGASLAQVLAGQNKPTVVGENARGIWTPGKGLENFPEQPGPPPFTPPAGSRAVPTVGPRGEVKSTRFDPPSENQMRAAAALKDAGWAEDMPGYAQALYQLTTPLTPVTEGGFAVPRTMTVPPPPRARIDPRVPLAQQPTVQDAGKARQDAVGNLATQAGGVPGGPRPAPGPQRMPGGGIQGPPKTQAIGQEQVQKLADMKSFLSALDTAEQLYEPGFTGPIEGRLGGARQFSGIRATQKETQFRTVLQSFANQLLYLRSGAAVTPQEYERILKELPTANDPDGVFLTKLRTAKQLLSQAVKQREAEFAQYGFRGAAPGGGQAPVPTTTKQRRRFNPATGRLE